MNVGDKVICLKNYITKSSDTLYNKKAYIIAVEHMYNPTQDMNYRNYRLQFKDISFTGWFSEYEIKSDTTLEENLNWLNTL